MQNQKNHQKFGNKVDFENLKSNFPFWKYSKMRNNQMDSFNIIVENPFVCLELPTGSGKTDIAGTVLTTMFKKNATGALIYTAPTKALVDQFKTFYPESHILYGRNEYECLFYTDRGKKVNAADCPCYLLDCPHRIDQAGAVQETEFTPCPYLQAKLQARSGGIVAMSTACFLVNRIYQSWPKEISCVVVDEAHKIADIVRSIFSYNITDNLKKIGEMLSRIDQKQAQQVNNFLKVLVNTTKTKPKDEEVLLMPHEILKLIQALEKIELWTIIEKIREAIRNREIDPVQNQEDLKLLEDIGLNVRRYITSLGFSLGTTRRNPLNYVFSFCRKTMKQKEKAEIKLCIRSHYAVPLVRKALADAERVIACSATIGRPKVFSFETGIDYASFSFFSEFPVENTRIFLPKDTPNLAYREIKKNPKEFPRALNMIAQAVVEFKKAGHRSLVVVISDKERELFLDLCNTYSIETVSYGNGIKPKEAVALFKTGKGDILVGTAANYSHGIDLPKEQAGVIFFLRPGYPKPDDPASKFEEQRFGQERWKLINHRVTLEALQIRGRNIRSAEDLGVSFFISQQFARFLESALPEWLLDSFQNQMTMQECIMEGIQLLNIKNN